MLQQCDFLFLFQTRHICDLLTENMSFTVQVLDSLVVRISACHVEGPGSIPGRGVTFYYKTVNVTVADCNNKS